MTVIDFRSRKARPAPERPRVYTSGEIRVYKADWGWWVIHMTESHSSVGDVGSFSSRKEAEACALRAAPSGRLHRLKHMSWVELPGAAV